MWHKTIKWDGGHTPVILAFGRWEQRIRSTKQPQLCREFETSLDLMRPIKCFKRYIRIIETSTDYNIIKDLCIYCLWWSQAERPMGTMLRNAFSHRELNNTLCWAQQRPCWEPWQGHLMMVPPDSLGLSMALVLLLSMAVLSATSLVFKKDQWWCGMVDHRYVTLLPKMKWTSGASILTHLLLLLLFVAHGTVKDKENKDK